MRWQAHVVLVVLLAAGVPAAGQVGEIEDPSGSACLSPAGEARCPGLSVSGAGNASNGRLNCFGVREVGCVALSGTGEAENGDFACGATIGCVAVSGTGEARNADEFDLFACRAAIGCVALSAAGPAENAGAECQAGIGCVAVSGTDDASTAGSGSCTAFRVGCIAVSGAGNASNPNDCSAQIGCIAVSGTGRASGPTALSGCESADEAGSEVLCLEAETTPADREAMGADVSLAALLGTSLPVEG